MHKLNAEPLLKLLQGSKDNEDYWVLVFRSLLFLDDETVKFIVGKEWLNVFYLKLKKDMDVLGHEVYGDDYPEFERYNYLTKVKKEFSEKMIEKPSKTWYPRLLAVEDRVDTLKDIKGSLISNKILSRLLARYDHLKGLEEYARNRHNFIVSKGWWNDNVAEKTNYPVN